MNKIDNAIQLVEDGNIEQGLELLEQLQNSSTNDELYVIAQHYFKWGFVEKSKEIVQQLLYIYPDEGELYVLLAEIMIDMDEEEEAISLLDQIAEDDPAYIEALVLQADLFQMQGLVEVSEQKLLRAKEMSDHDQIIDFALAELYSSNGEFYKSIPYYMEILQESEQIAGVLVSARLAESLSATGKFEEALPYFEAAISKQEDSHTLFGFGVTAYQAEYYSKAIEVFSKLKDLDPDYTSLYFYLAEAYEKEGLLDESLQVLQQGIQVDSLNKELHFKAAMISLKCGHRDRVEQYLREAVGIDPGYVEATLQLSNFLLNEERYDDVVECLEAVMGYGEFDEQFEWDLAYSKNKLEQFSDALNHYRRAYTFFKESPEFLEEFGYFLLEDGKKTEAIDVFKKLLVINPSKYEIEELLEDLA
ncbi:tetratricopeptide repeat protein [Ferdinandcohnia quinoae]|uniref:Tetratricopeptide repeat protein n=1 Tax=Fredinandcohnia quinoae TaxID=2918902 RepID=A0AAW5DVS3_9BACI|nr:tetratricopeptide repeat protein [Fredinandcohnia sp. SECRCQ15]MCH1624736.1 tetratricopeptide repeat protein [Fredinandcohnia sp. SECRCQ15]